LRGGDLVKSVPAGRLYYSISEVSDMMGVKPHVLRYWETQFRMLRPKKGRGGARMYRRRDVELLFEIKKLLYDQRFTIAGARRKMLDDRAAGQKEQIELPFHKLERSEMVRTIRRDLEDVLELLKRDGAAARSRSRR
jgi:DNA-binding transcriptional MerR regulator